MHRLMFTRLLIRIILLLLPMSLLATTHTNIGQHIDQMIANLPNDTNIGIIVRSVNSGKIIYQRNANRYYIPASTTKLFTASAALLQLSKDFYFTTRISSHQQVKNGVLRGDLLINFQGDTSFTGDDLQQLIQQLRQKGIKQIIGNVYLVSHRFAGKAYGHGWMWDDINNCFSAPVHALMINHNCFDVGLKAGKRNSQATQLTVIDDQHFTPIINHTMTREHTKTDPDNCALDVNVTQQNRYTLHGCVAPNTQLTLSFAINNVKLYAQQLVGQALAREKIALDGKIYTSEKNLQGKFILASHYSQPLEKMLIPLLHDSDNTLSDSLLKTIGASYYQTRGDRRNGLMAMRAILNKHAQLADGTKQLVDGAGLSRYNLLQPKTLTQLLVGDFNRSTLVKVLMDALPTPAQDAGLRYFSQSRQTLLANRVKVKSGMMRGIFTLAGYFVAADNQIYAFAIMANNFTSKATPYALFSLAMLKYLINNK